MTLALTPLRSRTASRAVCVAISLLASAIAPGTVRAQAGFTELSLTDTLFNTSPDTDSWIASVRAVDNSFSGSAPSPGSFVFGVTSVQPTSPPRPLALALATANPSAGAWRVIVSLERRQHVSIGVYDVSGHRVARLLDGVLGSGPHDVAFDGRGLPSGLYFIHAYAESGSVTQRVTVLH